MKTRWEKNKKKQKEITKEVNQKKIKKIVKILTIISLFVFATLLYGIFIGARVIDIKEYKIENSNLPISFHGVKVVHFSDLLYPSIKENDLENLGKKINNLEADILIFTGDIKQDNVSLNKDDLELLENFFKNLKANISKLAIYGDLDDESFKVIMENSNFKILNNEMQILYNNDIEPIQIIGVNSNDLNLDTTKIKNLYTICLLHNPDKIKEVLSLTNCNVALAGDNLGGEIKIPFKKGIFNRHTYDLDYYKINATELYISNGIGNNMNIRLFNHPSISLYRLTKY